MPATSPNCCGSIERIRTTSETAESRRQFKQLVAHHEDLSREQARLKSRIKARLRCLGMIRFDARIFTKSGQSALFNELKEPSVKLMLAQTFGVLTNCSMQKLKLNKQ